MRTIQHIATIRVRITKIICPCCKGSGEWFSLPPFPPFRNRSATFLCQWCLGAKRLRVADARRYADNLYTIAIGGYMFGDHDIKDRDRMTADAAAVFKLLGEVPPWIAEGLNRRSAA